MPRENEDRRPKFRAREAIARSIERAHSCSCVHGGCLKRILELFDDAGSAPPAEAQIERVMATLLGYNS
jgi:hypothetical protein